MSACASCPVAGWSSTERQPLRITRRPSRMTEHVLDAAPVMAGGGSVMASHEQRTFAQRAVLWFTAAVGVALLAGCAVGPGYRRPPGPGPDAYGGGQAPAGATPAPSGLGERDWQRNSSRPNGDNGKW